MKSLCIKDTDTENFSSENIKLSILFTQNGLSYSLFHIESQKYIALVSKYINESNDYLDQCFDFIESEKLIKYKHQEVNIIIATKEVTIIPDAFYLEERKNDLYNLSFELASENDLYSSYLERSDNIVIFPVRKSLKNRLQQLFGKINLLSLTHPFIENHYHKNKIAEDSNGAKMFVHVLDDFIEVIVLDNTELTFYNSFRYKTNNDILYYIINVFEQLKLSQTETPIVFSGFIDTDNLTILNLRKFVSQVYFESQNTDYKYYFKFQETLPHYFYNFLNVC